MCAFGFDHESDLSRTSEQTTMFTCTGLHVTNPVIASRCINMRTASKSVCSVLVCSSVARLYPVGEIQSTLVQEAVYTLYFPPADRVVIVAVSVTP